MEMSRTPQKDIKAVPSFFLTERRVSPAPVSFRLRPCRPRHHRNCVGEPRHHVTFSGTCRLAELAIPIPHISSSRDPSSNVVIQISRQMQHKMSKTVPERKRLLPELFLTQRLCQLTNLSAKFLVASRESLPNRLVQQRIPPCSQVCLLNTSQRRQYLLCVLRKLSIPPAVTLLTVPGKAFLCYCNLPVAGDLLMPRNSSAVKSAQSAAQATLRSTSAEFFDPNAMQLHTACSITAFRPT